MRKWLAFSIVGILLLSMLQGGHGFLDSLLMLLFFLIFDRKGHIVVGLLVLALLVVREVRARRARELAGKQLVEVIRQRTAAMEARIALLEGRAPNVKAEGGKDGDQEVNAAEGCAVNAVAVASGSGAAGAESFPGKAGPDQASGNGVAAPRDVGGAREARGCGGRRGAGMASPVCGSGEDGCLRVLSCASVGWQCPSVCLWRAKAGSARGLIREVRDAPMNDAGMPWVMPLRLG